MVKIHPFSIVTLFISMLTMVLYAIENFSQGNKGMGTTFIGLSIMFLAIGTYSIIRNCRLAKQ
ncbi:hypothetical protein SAMN04488574_101699 [Bacillus sp. 71mf]|nr:hypothetical protein SAMN04488574_101699 [Bacillus sp. 71mf]SFS75030.1 hypothetical protein SAMN04488145_10378 [Bacillus sp. 103mf]